jgi:hypothetical protein
MDIRQPNTAIKDSTVGKPWVLLVGSGSVFVLALPMAIAR